MRKVIKTAYLLLIFLAFHFAIKSQNIEWKKYYHFNGTNNVNTAIQTSDNGFLLYEYNDTTPVFRILKINKYGVVEWRKEIFSGIGGSSYFIKRDTNLYTYYTIHEIYDSHNKFIKN